MLLTMWHYLKGYVIVEVQGVNSERFLNLVTYHGIELWNIQRSGNYIRFCTSIPNFKAMRRDAHKTRSRLKIIYKKGLPFLINRYKNRKSFVVGIVVFIVMLWILSSFVWLVEVEGNTRLNSLDIIQTLEANGYQTGKLKSQMDLRDAETLLLKQYPDIIWVGVDYEGTRMIVHIAESTLPPTMHKTENTPSSLISKRDALITYIAVEKGKPMVKIGDIVKKGDMLVAGEMPLGEESESPYYATAKATVKGRTIYYVSKTMSTNQVKKHYTNDTSKKYILKLFNKDITLYNQKKTKEHYDTMHTLHQLKITNLFPLPFGLEVETQVAYEPTYYTLTKEEVEDKLLSDLWKEVSQRLGQEATIIKREVYFSQNEDQVTATLYVMAEEDISYAIETEAKVQNEGERNE